MAAQQDMCWNSCTHTLQLGGQRWHSVRTPPCSAKWDHEFILNTVLCCLQDEVEREETTANVKFLFVDCGPLKQMLTAHCQLWRNKLTNLLNNLAATELRSLHDHFRCVGFNQNLVAGCQRVVAGASTH